MFQSTHPYGVRPFRPDGSITFRSVSIHAPVWGATVAGDVCGGKSIRVSIHAPVWGATKGGQQLLNEFVGFNPRTRMGCDLQESVGLFFVIGFNPRTRMGCDVEVFKHWVIRTDRFNPRTRMGCDKISAFALKSSILFQSTHPYGVRRAKE